MLSYNLTANFWGKETIEFLIIIPAVFITAGLTLYSGFGLGTILMPVFALFFPVEEAIAATAVVHAVNSLFKIYFVGRKADGSIVLRFGLPAIGAAFLGAVALGYLSGLPSVAEYSVGAIKADIRPVKLVIGILIFCFAVLELLTKFKDLKMGRKYLPAGGIVSGFFGGLSGHHGAVRAAFLVKSGISAEKYVGTNAMISFMVDFIRIIIYGFTFFFAKAENPIDMSQWPLIAAGVISAFFGVLIGKKFLHKITMRSIRVFAMTLLLFISFGLISGVV